MTLQFTLEDGLFVAEFEATSRFNLHLERPASGSIYMKQKTVKNGSYVIVKDFGWNRDGDLIIDADCGQGAVYPKWIRLESAVEPSVAEVTFESESSGGGAGAKPEIVYLTEASGMILEVALPGPSYLAKYKKGNNIVIGPIASTAANFAQGTIQVTDFIAVAFFKAEVYFPDGSVMSFDEFISFMTNAGANFIEITKEQFYNLEA